MKKLIIVMILTGFAMTHVFADENNSDQTNNAPAMEAQPQTDINNTDENNSKNNNTTTSQQDQSSSQK
jgi:hypothetical protein